MMLASAYLGGVYFFGRALFAQRWHHIAIGFVPVTAFASFMCVATLLHLDKFNQGHVSFITWQLLYFTTPFLVLGAWLRNRRSRPRRPGTRRLCVSARGACFHRRGSRCQSPHQPEVVFFSRTIMVAIWPWPLTPAHARVSSAACSRCRAFLPSAWRSIRGGAPPRILLESQWGVDAVHPDRTDAHLGDAGFGEAVQPGSFVVSIVTILAMVPIFYAFIETPTAEEPRIDCSTLEGVNMASNDYHFVTHWRIRGALPEVAAVLGQAGDPGQMVAFRLSRDVQEIEQGQTPMGSAGSFACTPKGWLPYTLHWSFRVTESSYPFGFSLEAWGDFVGRGIWSFEQQGEWVDAGYDWNIRADKPLLRALSFVLKPVFGANHRWAMRMGEESLVLELRRRHATAPEECAHIPPPPASYLQAVRSSCAGSSGGSLRVVRFRPVTCGRGLFSRDQAGRRSFVQAGGKTAPAAKPQWGTAHGRSSRRGLLPCAGEWRPVGTAGETPVSGGTPDSLRGPSPVAAEDHHPQGRARPGRILPRYTFN